MIVRDNKPPQFVQERDPPMVTPLERLNEHAQWIDCPACKRRTRTNVTKEGGGMQLYVTVSSREFCLDLVLNFTPIG